MIDHLVLLAMPGLRPVDLEDETTAPTLSALARRGGCLPLEPSFPCVTSPVQASMLTGVGPGTHGVIANGFYYRDRKEVEFWVARHGILDAESIFTRLAREQPRATSMVWHAQNIKDAEARIVTPSPIHEEDGTTKLWCYSKPDGHYEELLAELGHFPLQHYWGPLANIESTKWILEAALWESKRRPPNFHYIYIPHLDYQAQRFGPDSPQARAALAEFDSVLAEFLRRYEQLPIAESTAWMVAGEYAMTEVGRVVHANRLLREAGLLSIREEGGYEYLEIGDCDAFAMVDHQCAHVYVQKGHVQRVAEVFEGRPGVARVLVGEDRRQVGMTHPRCGEIVLVSEPDAWFSYYWWQDDAAAPPFARTVDIHAKPGYDPVEMFIKMPEKEIPLDALLVRGSHGAPVTRPDQRTALAVSDARLLEGCGEFVRDTHVYGMIARAMGLS